MRIQVKDFMTIPVVTTVPERDVAFVRELMERKEVHAIPIVEYDGDIEIKGIITATDLIGIPDETIQAKQVMTKNLMTVSPEMDAREAARLMLDKGIHHLIVLKDDQVAGMVSAMDFVRLVARYME